MTVLTGCRGVTPVICRLLTLMTSEEVFDEFYDFLKLILGSVFYLLH